MPLLGKEDFKVKASLGYGVRPCLKTNKEREEAAVKSLSNSAVESLLSKLYRLQNGRVKPVD